MDQQTDYTIFPEKTVTYAGFWPRFGAAFIDYLVLAIPNYVISYTMGRMPALLLNAVLSWLYFALMESGAGMATLGKRALQLKVTDMNGGRITFGTATGRYFAKILSALILLIGYLMMLWSDKKQTLHDKLAGTLVIAN